jgi:hypothetical protein
LLFWWQKRVELGFLQDHAALDTRGQPIQRHRMNIPILGSEKFLPLGILDNKMGAFLGQVSSVPSTVGRDHFGNVISLATETSEADEQRGPLGRLLRLGGRFSAASF